MKARNQKNLNSWRFKRFMTSLSEEDRILDGNKCRQLKQIGLKLFSMTSSSAALGLDFPTMGFIHRKIRNSLYRLEP